MHQNRPIFRQSIASCSSDNCDCCDVYYSDEDESEEDLSSSSSSTETDSTCSCNDQPVKSRLLPARDGKAELSWIDHFTDRNGVVCYLKYLNEEPNGSPSKTIPKSAQKKFKKRWVALTSLYFSHSLSSLVDKLRN